MAEKVGIRDYGHRGGWCRTFRRLLTRTLLLGCLPKNNRTPECLLTAEVSCLGDVEVHLLDQGIDRVEAEGAAQPGVEVDRGVESV